MRTLLAALALVAPSAAQVVVEATLLSRTVQCGGSAVAQPLPGGDVTAGLQIGVPGASAMLQHANTPAEASVGWNLQCVPPWIGAATADVEIRYVFTAPVVMPATLALGWWATTSGNGSAGLVVDVHDDGVVDASGGGALAVTLGPTPLVVRVRGAVAAVGGTTTTWFTPWHWTGTASAQLSLQVLPAHAQVASIAPACSGAAPVLQVAPDFVGGLARSGRLGAADELALWTFGFVPTAPLPLPWSNGCVLAVTPDVLVMAPVPPARVSEWSLALPAALRPAAFDVQLLGVDLAPFGLGASAAFHVTAP